MARPSLQNFRPDVIERLGLDYESVRAVCDRVVYGSVFGYGDKGPWRDKPGQDLLAQALSGSMWLNGNQDQPPTPVGLSIADMLTGNNLAQGISCLVGRGITGKGGRVETNLLEAMMDYQFEVVATHLNDGGRRPVRSAVGSAHPHLGACGYQICYLDGDRPFVGCKAGLRGQRAPGAAYAEAGLAPGT